MCINFVHNHTFGTEAKPICHLATIASHSWKMQFRVQPVLSQQSKFIPFLLSPEVFASCSDHQSPKQLLSWPLTDGKGTDSLSRGAT